MAETTNISIRMDKDLKEQADKVFNEMGMNLSTAFNIFVRQTIRQGKIPFDIYTDPLYSEKDLNVLRKSIKATDEGKLIEHELIDD